MLIFLLILTIFCAAVGAAFRFTFVRSRHPAMWNEPPESAEEHVRLADAAVSLPHFHWEMRTESLTLRARYFPGNRPSAVVLIHGYRGESLHDHAKNILFYTSRGYHVLAPDLRAHGESEGILIRFGLYESTEIAAWCDLLKSRTNVSDIILHGVSMGGAAAILTAAKFPVRAVIADSAFTSARQMADRVVDEILRIGRFPIYRAMLLLARFFGIRTDRPSPIDSIKNVRVPILLIHGAADKFVPPAMSEALFSAAKNARLVMVEGARHAEANEADPARFYQTISDFIGDSAP